MRFVVTLILSMCPFVVVADEVRLICEGVVSGTRQEPAGESTDPVTGETRQEYVGVPYKAEVIREIRFNEKDGEFWYKGGRGLSNKGSQDGWIPAKEVEFGDSEIVAEFRSGGSRLARDILTLGVNRMMNPGPPVGVLDRYSGLWRMAGATLTCRKIEMSDRKF